MKRIRILYALVWALSIFSCVFAGEQNHYDLLQLPTDVTQDAIDATFYLIFKEFPDAELDKLHAAGQINADTLTERFNTLDAQYETSDRDLYDAPGITPPDVAKLVAAVVLMDPTTRAEYDKTLGQQEPPVDSSDQPPVEPVQDVPPVEEPAEPAVDQATLNEDLYNAFIDGQQEQMRDLIGLGADLNAKFDGMTILHHAIGYGDVVEIQVLLGMGFDPNILTDEREVEGSRGPVVVPPRSALGLVADSMIAARGPQASVQATRQNLLLITQMLLDGGAIASEGFINGVSASIASMGRNKSPEHDQFVNLLGGQPAVVQPQPLPVEPAPGPVAPSVEPAVLPAQPAPVAPKPAPVQPAAEQQVAGEADPNFTLHLAVVEGNIASATQALAAGADINLKDADELSPLMKSVMQGNLELVQLLVNNNADVNTKAKADQQGLAMTCVHAAVMLFSSNPTVAPAILELLLSKGADVNATDMQGSTPMHWALNIKSAEAVEVLAKHGAKTDIKNQAGSSAETLAQAWRSQKDVSDAKTRIMKVFAPQLQATEKQVQAAAVAKRSEPYKRKYRTFSRPISRYRGLRRSRSASDIRSQARGQRGRRAGRRDARGKAVGRQSARGQQARSTRRQRGAEGLVRGGRRATGRAAAGQAVRGAGRMQDQRVLPEANVRASGTSAGAAVRGRAARVAREAAEVDYVDEIVDEGPMP
ncbi:MAG: ankyrin repeat domain-containing protein [Epsilonproteobacteria bacterium]|nr:ankyrin repeat domain-containing protein [Campylobacterota bacterium]